MVLGIGVVAAVLVAGFLLTRPDDGDGADLNADGGPAGLTGDDDAPAAVDGSDGAGGSGDGADGAGGVDAGVSADPPVAVDDSDQAEQTTTTTDAEASSVEGGDGGEDAVGTDSTAAPVPGGPYYNDFSSGRLGPEWERYDSVGNQGWGLRRPSALAVVPEPGATGGYCLQITAQMGSGAEAGQLVSGGLKLLGHSQTFGRYTIRLRVDDDPSQVTSGVVLLWPSSNNWPQDGEINIVENFYNRDTRTPVESRLHWLSPDAVPPYDRADDALNAVEHAVDGTDWHTYTLEWGPDAVTIAVDGGTPKLLSGGAARIPTWDMDLTLQLDAFDFPNSGRQPVVERPVTMCVDFVQVEPL